ncbi:MAG: hypothetical protein QOJ80_3669, partial [Mycobacterium sp.]|nr:hypothetical protein [Mycobacterium sp.]
MSVRILSGRRGVAATAALAFVFGGAVVLAPAAGAAPSTTCTATSCTATFGYTGSTDTFTVPAGVMSLIFGVNGAQGGTSGFGIAGGRGASVGGALPVSPNQTLTVLVGQGGAAAGGATFGGGGATVASDNASGGGGSFLFAANGQLLVAAGGGGGGGVGDIFGNGHTEPGGDGAGPAGTGGSGVVLGVYPNEQPPTGGTPTTGGTGGANQFGTGGNGSGPAAAGAPGIGGDGSFWQGDVYEGAGGGGGYYGGGGGGYAMSGAGGSGYADPAVTDLTSTAGSYAGDGVISLTWSKQTASIGFTAAPAGGITQGDSVTLSASVSGSVGDPTGTVEFDVNGAPISGCGAQSISAGAASCVTTALPPGADSLVATYSGDTLYAPASTQSTSYPVAYPALSVTTGSVPDGTVDAPYSATLTATGGLAPYTWAVTSGSLPADLSLDSSSGSISGTPSAATAGADFAVTATDAQGTPYTASAPLTLVIAKATQTASFTSTAPVGATVGGSYDVAASGGASGNDVAFSIDAATTNSACSINGPTVSFDHAGTCVIDADQAGTANYLAALTAQQQVAVGPAAQAINFSSTAPDAATVGGSYVVAASGGASGNDVTFSIDPASTNSACSTNGATVSFDHAGTCVIDADQAGDADYTAAPTAQQQFAVGQAAQAITFTSVPPTSAVSGDQYTVTAVG